MEELDQKVFFKKSFNVSCETIVDLEKYHSLLVSNQKKFNLIGKSTVKKIWLRHFFDSANLYNFILDKSNNTNKEQLTVVDVGTGAGFPGMVLAIMLRKKKEVRISVIEANQKKVIFLEELKRTLNLNVEIINKRGELVNKKFDCIISRAVAKLDKLLEIVFSMCHTNTFLLFFKGKTWHYEIKSLKNKWKLGNLTVKNNNNHENSNGVILVIENLGV